MHERTHASSNRARCLTHPQCTGGITPQGQLVTSGGDLNPAEARWYVSRLSGREYHIANLLEFVFLVKSRGPVNLTI